MYVFTFLKTFKYDFVNCKQICVYYVPLLKLVPRILQYIIKYNNNCLFLAHNYSLDVYDSDLIHTQLHTRLTEFLILPVARFVLPFYMHTSFAFSRILCLVCICVHIGSCCIIVIYLFHVSICVIICCFI